MVPSMVRVPGHAQTLVLCLTRHAMDKLAQERIAIEDLLRVLAGYDVRRPGHGGAIVYRRQCNGRAISVVARLEGVYLTVITVYDANDGRWCRAA